MVTGFPPYDTPSREDERFEIICQGGLMKQLQAWESTFVTILHVVCCKSYIWMFLIALADVYMRNSSAL